MAHLKSFKAKLLRQFELEESRLRAASSVASESPLSPGLPEASAIRLPLRNEPTEISEHGTNAPAGRLSNHQPSSPTSAPNFVTQKKGKSFTRHRPSAESRYVQMRVPLDKLGYMDHPADNASIIKLYVGKR